MPKAKTGPRIRHHGLELALRESLNGPGYIASARYYGLLPGRTEQTCDKPSHNNWSSGQDSNRISPDCQSGRCGLTLECSSQL